DAPTITLLTSLLGAGEDAGPLVIPGAVTGVGPGGGSDEAGQTVTVLTSNDNNALFSVQPAIDAAGNLTFTTAPNAFGDATVTVVATDNGGTANGGSDTSTPRTFLIRVEALADTPSVTGAVTLEDTQTTTGLVITPNPVDGTSVTFFQITGIGG